MAEGTMVVQIACSCGEKFGIPVTLAVTNEEQRQFSYPVFKGIFKECPGCCHEYAVELRKEGEQ